MSAALTDLWVEDEVTPPPAPVRSAGASVLDSVRAHIARFTTLPSEAALDIATLWAAHTHVVDADERLAFDTTPRLAILATGPGAGKSVTLEAVLRMSFHPQQVLDATPASFALTIAEERATVGLDEIDILFGSGAAKGTLRSLLNGGYRRGATWKRANKAAISVFAPVALAGMGAKFRSAQELSPLRSRSIVIEMKPGHRGETYRAREHGQMAAALSASLTTWARRNSRQITETWPSMPDGIDGRAAEVAEPLLMVADAAGGRWPQAARDAIRELMLGESDEPDELALSDRLLADLRTVFGDNAKMSTIDITDALYALDGAPWTRLWPNPNTSPRELAAMLRPLGIEPCPIRIGEQIVRGYSASDLALAWE